MSAGWTTMFRRPSVSTKMWRLRPMTFLPASNPADQARSPFLSTLGALAVNDRSRRAQLASFPLAGLDIECVMDALQRPVPIPQHEIGMRGALRRQILRQCLPLAACREHIEDRVQNLAEFTSRRSPPRLAGGIAASISAHSLSLRSLG